MEGHPSPPELRNSWKDWCRFLVVACYLIPTLGWLLLTRQLCPRISLWQALRSSLAQQRGQLTGWKQEIGHCFVAPIGTGLISDAEDTSSLLMVYEDGKPLQPHVLHTVIRREGRGRFSHWAGRIYCAASDNSDPCTHGRTYTFAEIDT
jgi:hypothetical protein